MWNQSQFRWGGYKMYFSYQLNTQESVSKIEGPLKLDSNLIEGASSSRAMKNVPPATVHTHA